MPPEDLSQRRMIIAIVLMAVFGLLFLGAALVTARAHQASPTAAKPQGWAYPLSCCSNYDCRQVASDAISERPEGFVMPGTGEVVGYQDKRIRHSPDGEYHWCAHQSGPNVGKTICLFVPPRGF